MANVVLGAVIGVATRPVAAVGLVFAGVAFILFERLQVRIDERGLHAATGWGWPQGALPAAGHRAGSVLDVRPMQWGGWGYRGSVRLFHQAAWVLHRGPGIRLDLTESRVFVVTVDDAAAGVAALADLLTRPS